MKLVQLYSVQIGIVEANLYRIWSYHFHSPAPFTGLENKHVSHIEYGAEGGLKFYPRHDNWKQSPNSSVENRTPVDQSAADSVVMGPVHQQ
jgi:hypothetical protein